MEQRLSLVTLGVADVARSRRFYEALGWKGSGPADGSVVFFQAGGMIVSLWSRAALVHDSGLKDTGATFSGIALAHNVRRKEDVDAVIREAVAAGGTLVKAAADVFWGGYQGYFADPDRHVWEIAWNPGFTITADGLTRLPGQ